MARLIQVIESQTHRGLGVESNPVRIVTQWFTTEGELLAERDPWDGMVPKVLALLADLDAQLTDQYHDTSAMHPWWREFWPKVKDVLASRSR